MAVRVPTHAQALAAHRKFQADQTARRERLTKELAEAEAVYKAWVSPKATYERLKDEQRALERESAALHAESARAVSDTADPRIFAAITSLERELEVNGMAFTTLSSAERQQAHRKPNTKALDARAQAIRAATAELQALPFIDCDDVAGAISRILSKVPTLVATEFA